MKSEAYMSEQAPVDFHVIFVDKETPGFVGIQLHVEGLKSQNHRIS